MLSRKLLLLPVVALVLVAQDEAAFHKEMKSVDEHNAALRKMTPRTGDEAAAKASEIARLYGTMKEFWAKRSVADATQWSEDGKTAALALSAAAKAGEAEKAEASFKALGGTCRQCHTAHREKLPDGTYKIK